MSATVEETLAHEAEQRPRAGAAAIAAGVLTLGGNVLLTLVTRGGPNEDDGFISITESMSKRLAGQDQSEPSLLVRQVDYYGDKLVPLTLSTLVTTIAAPSPSAAVPAGIRRRQPAHAPAAGRVPSAPSRRPICRC